LIFPFFLKLIGHRRPGLLVEREEEI
jgi:hypothetical protein